MMILVDSASCAARIVVQTSKGFDPGQHVQSQNHYHDIYVSFIGCQLG